MRIARNDFSMSAGISACEKAGEWQQGLKVPAEPNEIKNWFDLLRLGGNTGI